MGKAENLQRRWIIVGFLNPTKNRHPDAGYYREIYIQIPRVVRRCCSFMGKPETRTGIYFDPDFFRKIEVSPDPNIKKQIIFN